MTANAPVATRFRAAVDNNMATNYVNSNNVMPWQAALMGQITGTASYCTNAVARTEFFVASEEAKIAAITASPAAPQIINDAWVPPLPDVAYDSYLDIGEHIGSLAMVYDWCRNSMTQAQRVRWYTYANQAVWNVWNHPQARWGNKVVPWTGWSVNNPVNNYYYSFLKATMLLGLATFGENPDAGTWLTQFRTTKIQNQLAATFTADLTGGGSREGTGYGTAMMSLWELYDWWERSTGERISLLTPHTLDSMAWMMHNVVPTLDRIAPTGDHARDETAMFFDYHRRYLLELMNLFPNERVSGIAKTLLSQSSVQQMGSQFTRFYDYMYEPTPVTARPLSELSTAYWGSGTGMFAMRNDWTTGSAYVNFLCGARTESHAHRDNGSFVLYKGSWLAYDANIDGTSGLELEEAYHNLVRFQNGGGTVVEQGYNTSCNMQALANTPTWAYGLARITPMYPAAQVTKSEREFVFIKPSTFVVFDRAQVPAASANRPIFTLNFPHPVAISSDTVSYVQGANRLDIKRLAPAAATVSQTLWSAADTHSTPPHYDASDTSTRVDVRDAANGTSSEFLHVFGVNNSVTAAVRDDASGQTGARITLADGRSVVLRFNTTGTGGTVQIFSTGGQETEGGTLPITVQQPPLYAN